MDTKLHCQDSILLEVTVQGVLLLLLLSLRPLLRPTDAVAGILAATLSSHSSSLSLVLFVLRLTLTKSDDSMAVACVPSASGMSTSALSITASFFLLNSNVQVSQQEHSRMNCCLQLALW